MTGEQWAQLAERARRRRRRSVGAVRRGHAPRRSCAARRPSGSSASRSRCGRAVRRPARRRARARGQRLDPAGVRALLRRPRARGAGGREARRHRQPRRRLVDEPRRLDQPRRRLERSATASTGSPTTPTRSCAGARSTHGQHIELGIAEGNLVGLLGELGATWSRDGQPLLPIGTLYDPFVNRALEPWSFGMYAGGQSILVGTPSGVTLAPEGGAHQSIITPSVGLEQPRCVAWEPAFGQDLEWTLLAGARAARPPRRHVRVLPAQHPAGRPDARRACPTTAMRASERRRQVLAGGYACAAPTARRAVTLVGDGRRAARGARRRGRADGGRHRRRRRLPHVRRPRLPRAAGAPGARRRRRRRSSTRSSRRAAARRS